VFRISKVKRQRVYEKSSERQKNEDGFKSQKLFLSEAFFKKKVGEIL
jgi:hypothetical protein